jgi:hypothetical protein
MNVLPKDAEPYYQLGLAYQGIGDPVSAKYVWGIGYHWYEDWTGGGKIFAQPPDERLIIGAGVGEEDAGLGCVPVSSSGTRRLRG